MHAIAHDPRREEFGRADREPIPTLWLAARNDERGICSMLLSETERIIQGTSAIRQRSDRSAKSGRVGL